MCPVYRSLVLAIVATALNLSCSSARPALNSERIEQRFGNYGVSIIGQTTTERLSGLYSVSADGERTIRTLAFVEFSASSAQELRDEHKRIICGASLGSTLKESGFTIDKIHTLTSVIDDPEYLEALGALMQMPATPAALSVHRYSLLAVRNGKSIPYASITEFHHPDYLTGSKLQEIYGTHNGSEIQQAFLERAAELAADKHGFEKCA